MDLKQGCVVPMHHHESEQLTWVRSGELRLIVGGVPHTVSAGSVLTIPSQVPHSAEALTDVRALDIFSPTRLDWINGTDSYLRPRAEKV
jgi:quercetin dioxygenase-like cupin family protein